MVCVVFWVGHDCRSALFVRLELELFRVVFNIVREVDENIFVFLFL